MDDPQLIKKICAGNNRAFNTLVDCWQHRIHRSRTAISIVSIDSIKSHLLYGTCNQDIVIHNQFSDENENKKFSKVERITKIENSYSTFVNQLKEIFVDYGRTLKSVQPDEHIFLSAALSGAGNAVPQRIDLQIKKSVLESMDSGSVSRERAMDQITVREY